LNVSRNISKRISPLACTVAAFAGSEKNVPMIIIISGAIDGFQTIRGTSPCLGIPNLWSPLHSVLNTWWWQVFLENLLNMKNNLNTHYPGNRVFVNMKITLQQWIR
jgi:hypothetical protein